MKSPGPAIAALLLIGLSGNMGAQQNPCDHSGDSDEARIVVWPLPAQSPCQERRVPPPEVRAHALPLAVRPEMLAYHIEAIAGQTVEVPYAHVIGVFESSVFLVDSRNELPPVSGNRARVLVFTKGTALRVTPTQLVGATVVVTGVARTVLGMKVSAEGWWPAALTPEKIKSLEIKAAILANSVKTADGVELTTQSSPSPTGG